MDSVNPIDAADKTSQEQDSGQSVDVHDALPLGGRDSCGIRIGIIVRILRLITRKLTRIFFGIFQF